MKAATIIAAGMLHAHSLCHHYRVWHYPYPQRCTVLAYAPPKHLVGAELHRPAPMPAHDIDIPLPDMSATWGEALDTKEELELIQGMQRLRALRLLSTGD